MAGVQARQCITGIGCSHAHYLDIIIVVRVQKRAGVVVKYTLSWMTYQTDFDTFRELGDTLQERCLPDVQKDCLCWNRC